MVMEIWPKWSRALEGDSRWQIWYPVPEQLVYKEEFRHYMELASGSTSVATRRPSFRVYPSKLPIGQMSNWCSKKSSHSWSWPLKNINSYQEAFFSHVSFKIVHGSKVKFGKVRWLGNTSLQASYPGLYQIANNKDCFVCQCRDNNVWSSLFGRNLNEWEVNDLLTLADLEVKGYA